MKTIQRSGEFVNENDFYRFQEIISFFFNKGFGGYKHNRFKFSGRHVFRSSLLQAVKFSGFRLFGQSPSRLSPLRSVKFSGFRLFGQSLSRPSLLQAVVLSGLLSVATTLAQTGTVLDNADEAPLQNAIVSLKSTGALVLTDEEGKFEFPGSAVTVEQKTRLSHSISFNHGMVSFTIDKNATPVTIQLFTMNGRKVADIADKIFSSGQHTLNFPANGTNLYVLKVRIGRTTTIHRLLTLASSGHPAVVSSVFRAVAPSGPRAVASTPDTLIVSKYLYTPKMQPLADNNTIKLTKPSTPPPPPGMKPIPGGTFTMGASNPDHFEQNEIPPHEVTLSPFYMDSTEVTQADYALLMGIEPWTEFTPKNPGFKYPGDDNLLPAWYLTWDDAVLYCNARSKRDGLDTVYSYSGLSSGEYGSNSVLADVEIDYAKSGYRLPTEAEWEYAARAGTRMEYYWADVIDSNAVKYARWDSDSPLPVASLLPNDYQLYDMVGNVYEFVNDYLSFYPDSSMTDPIGPSSGEYRCIRGGAWNVSLSSLGRIARRLSTGPGSRESLISQGIRVAFPKK